MKNIRKLIIPLLMIAAIVVVAQSGCAKPTTPTEPTSTQASPIEGVAIKPDGTSYYFPYTPLFLHNDWMVVASNLTINFLERAGARVTMHDAALDVNNQVAIMEDLIAKKPDAILIHPVDSAAMVPLCDKAKDAGIPVFDMDFIIDSDGVISCATHDQIAMGYACGQFFVDTVEKTGQTLYIYELRGLLGAEGENRRHQGFREAVDGNPKITVLESPGTDWVPENGYQALMDALPSHPEINAIDSHGGLVDATLEALRALDKLYPAGDPNHIYNVQCDEDPMAVEAIKNGYFDGASLHSPHEEVDAWVKATLSYVCCNEDVPNLVMFDSMLFTIDNLDQPRFGAPKIWGDMQRVDWDAWPLLDLPAEYGITTPTKDTCK